MRIFYDTEFIDDGTTIDLVSIGMVAEDGRELYAVSSEFDQANLHANPWLVDNVWPSLPTFKHNGEGRMIRCHCNHGKGHLDLDDPTVRTRGQIARMVAAFILATPDPQLWAYYSAYDHVAYAQLFGPMSQLPDGLPMQTDDIVTEAKRLGLTPSDLPEQPDGLHNALADARHNLVRARYLDEIARA
jgi:hypothetical protein